MVDLSFMEKKYSVDDLVSHYLEDIKALRTEVRNAADESKLQQYYQAANTFKRLKTMDLVKFALAYGRGSEGKAAQMRDAFSYILGNRITQPSIIDLAYMQLLLAYVIEFKSYRGNIKEWMLRFVISSPFSPLSTLVEREITYVIENTQQKIQLFKANL